MNIGQYNAPLLPASRTSCTGQAHKQFGTDFPTLGGFSPHRQINTRYCLNAVGTLKPPGPMPILGGKWTRCTDLQAFGVTNITQKRRVFELYSYRCQHRIAARHMRSTTPCYLNIRKHSLPKGSEVSSLNRPVRLRSQSANSNLICRLKRI